MENESTEEGDKLTADSPAGPDGSLMEYLTLVPRSQFVLAAETPGPRGCLDQRGVVGEGMGGLCGSSGPNSNTSEFL